MNYRAMAKAIRAERRATWDGLGRPNPSGYVFRPKPRQSGCEWYVAGRLFRQTLGIDPIPWADLYLEDYFIRMTDFFCMKWDEPARIDFIRTKWRAWATGIADGETMVFLKTD